MPFLFGALQFVKAYWKPLAIAAVLVVVFFAGWNVRDNSCDADRKAKEVKVLEKTMERMKQDAEELKRQQDEADQKGRELEEVLSRQRVTIRTLNRRLQDEVDQNPVYVDCRPTLGGLRSINDAIAGTPSTPEASGERPD